MIIDLSKRYGCTAYALFTRAGYIRHHNKKDYVKKDLNGRFHIKYEGSMLWGLHYDIDVEWRHFSMNLPERCGKERKKIIKILYYMSGEIIKPKVSNIKSPQTYADVLRKNKKTQPQVRRVRGLPTPPNPNKPKKFKPAYADPVIVKAELARIKLERESSFVQ